jgi:hypothetical protein
MWQAQYHPRSVYTLPGVWHASSELSGWGGAAPLALSHTEAHEALTERLRWFGEQCDQMQGTACPHQH